jgi:ribosomal protein L14E/L6E/L27E
VPSLLNIYHLDFYWLLVNIGLFRFDVEHCFVIYIGPHKLNGVPLRRVNQIYVIATSTKLDLSAAKFDNLDDKFFKRVRPAKKNAEKDIFDSKKEVK